MIVRGPRRADGFTILANDSLRDATLSFRARGILAYLLSQPPDWRINSEALARQGTEGRDAVRTALGELESAGYLVRTRERSDDGRITTVSVIHESPAPGEPTPGNPAPDNQAPIEELQTKEHDEADDESSDAQTPSAQSRERRIVQMYWDLHKERNDGMAPSTPYMGLVAVVKGVLKRGEQADDVIVDALLSITRVRPTIALVIDQIAERRRRESATPSSPAIPTRHLTWWKSVILSMEGTQRAVVAEERRHEVLTAVTIVTGESWGFSDFEAYFRLGCFYHAYGFGAPVTAKDLADVPLRRGMAFADSYTALSVFAHALRVGVPL